MFGMCLPGVLLLCCRTVLPENAYMGLDDVLRLGHLCLAIDQTSDRPKSRTTLLDYMAPEMLSIRPHNEHELALLNDDSSDDGSSSSMDGSGATGAGQQQQQQYWESLHDGQQQGQQQQQVPRDHLGLLGHTGPLLPTASAVKQHTEEVLLLDEEDTSTSHPHQQQQHHSHHHHHQQQQGSRVQQSAELEPSRQASLDATALEQFDESAQVQVGVDAGTAGPAAALDRLMVHSKAPRCGSRAFLGPCRGSGRADWEYQDHYDEKVDIWQLGCMLHELLCGSMPFEVGNWEGEGVYRCWATPV